MILLRTFTTISYLCRSSITSIQIFKLEIGYQKNAIFDIMDTNHCLNVAHIRIKHLRLAVNGICRLTGLQRKLSGKIEEDSAEYSSDDTSRKKEQKKAVIRPDSAVGKKLTAASKLGKF